MSSTTQSIPEKPVVGQASMDTLLRYTLSDLGGNILQYWLAFERTGVESFRALALEGMAQMETHLLPLAWKHFGLYEGISGIWTLYLQAYQHTQDSNYLVTLESLMPSHDIAAFINSEYTDNSLSAGRAGLLLALLQVQAQVPQWHLQSLIQTCGRALLAEAHLGAQGPYWEYRHEYVQPPCGLANGNAGIGLALILAGYYGQDDTLTKIGQAAMMQLLYQWNDTLQNWPTYASGVYTGEDYQTHRTALLEGNEGFFLHQSDDFSWAKGLSGIGLAFYLAGQVVNDANLMVGADRAETRLEKEGDSDAWPLLKALSKGADQQQIWQDRMTALCHQESLSMAQLQALQNTETMPWLPGLHLVDWGTRQGTAILQHGDHEKVLQKTYGRSWHWLGLAKQGDQVLALDEHPLTESGLYEYIQQEIGTTAEGYRVRGEDLLRLEATKAGMAQAVGSISRLYMADALQYEEAERLFNLSDEDFQQETLTLHPKIKMMEVGWDWHFETKKDQTTPLLDQLDKEAEEYAVLLKAVSSTKAVTEQYLTDLSYEILLAFEQERTVQEGVAVVVEAFEVESEGERKQAEGLVLDQVNELISNGILCGNKGRF